MFAYLKLNEAIHTKENKCDEETILPRYSFYGTFYFIGPTFSVILFTGDFQKKFC